MSKLAVFFGRPHQQNVLIKQLFGSPTRNKSLRTQSSGRYQKKDVGVNSVKSCNRFSNVDSSSKRIFGQPQAVTLQPYRLPFSTTSYLAKDDRKDGKRKDKCTIIKPTECEEECHEEEKQCEKDECEILANENVDKCKKAKGGKSHSNTLDGLCPASKPAQGEDVCKTKPKLKPLKRKKKKDKEDPECKKPKPQEDDCREKEDVCEEDKKKKDDKENRACKKRKPKEDDCHEKEDVCEEEKTKKVHKEDRACKKSKPREDDCRDKDHIKKDDVCENEDYYKVKKRAKGKASKRHEGPILCKPKPQRYRNPYEKTGMLGYLGSLVKCGPKQCEIIKKFLLTALLFYLSALLGLFYMSDLYNGGPKEDDEEDTKKPKPKPKPKEKPPVEVVEEEITPVEVEEVKEEVKEEKEVECKEVAQTETPKATHYEYPGVHCVCGEDD